MSVVHLHVALEEIEPVVTRRIEVPASLRLDRLHLVLQAAMPWQNYHLYEFEAAGRRWGLPDPDYGPDYGGEETSPAAKATLADMLEAAGDGSMGYLYDFGDSWRHAITLEATLASDPSHLYPRLTEVTGACPPEDVGGTPGYERFLEVLADPDHPEHADLLTWAGGPFDPHVPPADELRLDVLKLAKRWKTRKR